MSASNDTTNTLKKTCTKCGTEFPATLEYFSANKLGKFGLQSQCRECRRQWDNNYNATHKEKKRLQWKQSRIKNKEHIKRYAAKYYAEHLEQRRNYPSQQKEARRIRGAAHYAKNRMVIQRRHKEYALTPKGKLAGKTRNHNRRLRLSNSGERITTSELQDVLKAHTDPKTGNLICAFCGKPIKGAYHLDHWIPLKHGGPNNAGNLRVMHPKCNLKKQATHPHKLGRLL